MQPILTCLRDQHDAWLLALAGLVCALGVYGALGVARHAARADGPARPRLAAISLVAAGCTAWATHMIAILAYEPGMPAAFEPILTGLSLVLGILGIAAGLAIAIGYRRRSRRLAGGLVLGIGIVLLHYVGQTAYAVTGHVTWDRTLVAFSILGSLPLFALAMMLAGESSHTMRSIAAPLLLVAIVVLHVTGMAALQLTYDPSVALPAMAVSLELLAPIVAAIGVGLLGVTLLGLSLTIRARARLREDQKRLGELANLALEGLAICDDGIVVSANEGLARLTGKAPKDLVGQSLASLLPGFSLDDIPEDQEIDAGLVGLEPTPVPVRVLRRRFGLGTRQQTVVAFRDQRERLRSEERIRTLAYSDGLTGLANRERFNDLLASRLAQFREHETPFSLLLIDLDGFKAINDTYGHSVGDEVLRAIGNRLRGLGRDDLFAARLGGDEFTVLVPSRDPLQLTALGERIIQAIEAPIETSDQVVNISASIGALVVAETCGSPEQVLGNADLALYDAKTKGRGRVRLFTQELRSAAVNRANTAVELRDAFEDGDLEVYYQPQVRLDDGALVGAEALLRWNYCYRGVLSPASFLPVLETSSLAPAVGNWILETGCRQAALWREAGSSAFRIGVNLFAAQLRAPDFADTVRATLARHGLPPEALELEVTENIILNDDGDTIQNLHTLRNAGIGIAFDDFGTGFASLTMLKEIPINRLKIDRSFVREIASSRKDQAIVDAISRMATGCDLTVIAEGIETEQQAAAMRPYASEAQGYLYGRPMTARAFEDCFLSSEAADNADMGLP